nr:nickel pincer cofactor biosynthesis protein LarC [uncultured Friedmanniella sp.]
MSAARHAWIDASAGVAGDMLLGALVDAGAHLAGVQAAVDAVVPGAVRLVARDVLRAGQHGCKVDVEVLTEDLPHRHWREIRAMVTGAELSTRTRQRVLATFGRLAEAEATVHGTDPEQVHFHEVGALDSIADVVGVCAALDLLDVATLSAGPVAVGSGRIHTAHGDIAVPVPAVVQLSDGWRVLAGGRGELATPTGMALVVALSERCEDLPALVLSGSGAGAGTKDDPERPNLTRVLLGTGAAPAPSDGDSVTVLEANIDDLDPRLWPGVLDRLLDVGALDAWLVPILMKKGRPAHTLTVLAHPHRMDALRSLIFVETSTLGVRASAWSRSALPRGWVDVVVQGAALPVKVGHRNGRIVRATPEFDNVEQLARRTGRPVPDVLAEALGAVVTSGLLPGSAVPATLRSSVEAFEEAGDELDDPAPGTPGQRADGAGR